ncbi:hypothetical protein AK812_SmicGene30295 [Symbiodinium microadriaticum]|uniref:Uncharacterized protein n=1 Tax=Symbiodinium microadriaticum TaxID=2951 RepID=A0A1Q9CZN8_SYMMI|nr:hypothetical protein AK812_SmicGene30295 [Symbiodinium microadriaticum]
MLIAPSTLGATGLVAAEGKHADYGGGTQLYDNGGVAYATPAWQFAVQGDTPSPPPVPRALSARERAWVSAPTGVNAGFLLVDLCLLSVGRYMFYALVLVLAFGHRMAVLYFKLPASESGGSGDVEAMETAGATLLLLLLIIITLITIIIIIIIITIIIGPFMVIVIIVVFITVTAATHGDNYDDGDGDDDDDGGDDDDDDDEEYQCEQQLLLLMMMMPTCFQAVFPAFGDSTEFGDVGGAPGENPTQVSAASDQSHASRNPTRGDIGGDDDGGGNDDVIEDIIEVSLTGLRGDIGGAAGGQEAVASEDERILEQSTCLSTCSSFREAAPPQAAEVEAPPEAVASWNQSACGGSGGSGAFEDSEPMGESHSAPGTGTLGGHESMQGPAQSTPRDAPERDALILTDISSQHLPELFDRQAMVNRKMERTPVKLLQEE